MLRFLRIGTALAAMIAPTAVGAPLAMAQDKYPSRPVKIVVPLPAGTSPDIRTRIIAEQLTKTWGQQVVVENRPGGGGVAGVQAVLSAPADGYTLLAATATIYTILPARASRPEIDVNRDLVPIGLIDHEGLLVAVSPKLGVNTLADLIALAKREPYKIVIPGGSFSVSRKDRFHICVTELALFAVCALVLKYASRHGNFSRLRRDQREPSACRGL